MAQLVTTSRLILEPCTRAHLKGYHRIWSDSESTFWSSRGRSDSLATSEKWLDNVRNDPERHNLFSWAVFHKESSEEMIGIIVLSRSPPSMEIFDMECLLVGYFFHPSSWGNGYATEALEAGIESVQDQVNGGRLVAWITPGNTASERVVDKCGFTHSKYHRRNDSKVFVGGEWRENEYNLFVRDL